jgi:hypothetical protein
MVEGLDIMAKIRGFQDELGRFGSVAGGGGEKQGQKQGQNPEWELHGHRVVISFPWRRRNTKEVAGGHILC